MWALPTADSRALGARLRVHDRHFGRWAMYFCVAVAALALNLAYHGPW